MNLKIKLILFTFFLNTYPVSLVYNIKIRRIFNISAVKIFHKKKKSIFVTSIVPIVSKRDRHIVKEDLGVDLFEKSLIGGSLLNFRYISDKNWWFEATTGIEKETAKYRGSSCYEISRFGLDDIVLSAGYTKYIGKNKQFVLYGLIGLPTHKDVTILETFDTLVGTRFYGLGFGSEFSYSPIFELKQALNLITQIRFIHFFNRKWFPILPENAKIQPGNLTDLLFTIQYRKKRNIFELGYNPTFFTNQAIILCTGKVKSPNFLRNSLYFTASHFFEKSIFHKPLLLGLGISIGDSKMFQAQTLSFWINFSLIF